MLTHGNTDLLEECGVELVVGGEHGVGRVQTAVLYAKALALDWVDI